MERARFLVSYDYGQGAAWAYLIASSPEEIVNRYPELQVHHVAPASLSAADLKRVAATLTIDIAHSDHPFLRALRRKQR